MKIFKSHFWYSKNQRNGIFLLLLIIIILQAFVIFEKEDTSIYQIKDEEILIFQNKIDSLKSIALENAKPKIFPFNPNYISDFKGFQLGMSTEEIDRLHAFREEGKFINSKKDFKRVTKVSDSLLAKIAPYFKFPEWVNQKNRNQKSSDYINQPKPKFDLAHYAVTTNDLNKATFKDLLSVKGINENLAQRIIKYRSKLKGFYFEDQLYEVFNISSNQVAEVLKKFTILEKPLHAKKNVNTITFRELLKLPYIDYELCKHILDYRDQVAELQNIEELKNVTDFPKKHYDRIVLYLKAE